MVQRQKYKKSGKDPQMIALTVQSIVSISSPLGPFVENLMRQFNNRLYTVKTSILIYPSHQALIDIGRHLKY